MCIRDRAQLASLESSDPFYAGGSIRKSCGVLEGRYKNTFCNYGKIHSYAAVNTFNLPKQIFSSFLNTPNSFIWVEGHFRPIYLEEITKIEPVLKYSSQFRYISMVLRWSTLVTVVLLLKICIWSIPLHIIVPSIPLNHQFRVPNFSEINFFTSTDNCFIHDCSF